MFYQKEEAEKAVEDTKEASKTAIQVIRDWWGDFVDMLPQLVVAVVVLVLVIGLSVAIKKFIFNRIAQKSKNRLAVKYLGNIVQIVLIIAGLLLGLHIMNLSYIAGSLVAGAGVSALVIGFAFKDIGENFLAGFILAFRAPFRIGDTVTIGDFTGIIQSLDMRTTHILTFDSQDVYMPNAKVLTNPVINRTQNNLFRQDFLVGIDYEDDVPAAEGVIMRTVEQIKDVLETPAPFVAIDELSVSTVNLRVFFFCSTTDYRKTVLMVKNQVMSEVKRELLEAGFGMPANIQELKLYQERPIQLNITDKKNMQLSVPPVDKDKMPPSEEKQK